MFLFIWESYAYVAHKHVVQHVLRLFIFKWFHSAKNGSLVIIVTYIFSREDSIVILPLAINLSRVVVSASGKVSEVLVFFSYSYIDINI